MCFISLLLMIYIKVATIISTNQLRQAPKVSYQQFTWSRLAWSGRTTNLFLTTLHKRQSIKTNKCVSLCESTKLSRTTMLPLWVFKPLHQPQKNWWWLQKIRNLEFLSSILWNCFSFNFNLFDLFWAIF